VLVGFKLTYLAASFTPSSLILRKFVFFVKTMYYFDDSKLRRYPCSPGTHALQIPKQGSESPLSSTVFHQPAAALRVLEERRIAKPFFE
jgi:hypothetical protein